MRHTRNFRWARALFALGCLALGASLPAQSDLEWSLARSIPLPGRGPCSDLALSADGSRLWIARGSHLQEVATRSGALLADIGGLDHAVAVALDDQDGRAYVCEAGADRIAVFDLRSELALGGIAVESRPVALAYDRASGMVLVCCAGTRALVRFPANVDPAHHAVPTRVALLATPVAVAVDADGRAIVACADADQAVAVDCDTLAVCARHGLAAGASPRGLALDRAHHRIFVATAARRLAVVDGDYGGVVAQAPIGADAGAVAFHDQLVYTACGDGTLTLVHEDQPNRYVALASVATALDAKAIAVDPVRGIAYLAAMDPHAGPAVGGVARLLVVVPPAPEIAGPR